MKKSKKIIAASAVILLMAAVPVSVLAKDMADKKMPVYEEMETSSLQSISYEKEFSSQYVAAKIDSSRVLKELSLKSSNMQSFEPADYFNLDIKYEAKFDDGSVVSFDQNMNIIAYSNFDRKTESSQTSNDAFMNILKQEYNIDETYQLYVSYEANESDNDDIKYYWQKTEKNGCQNPYDALSVRIDGKTNEIVLFNRFNDVAKPSEIKITEEEAKQIALSFKEAFTSVTSCEKAYVMSNDFWNEERADETEHTVRLAYTVSLNENRFIVYVDAETGKVLGGDMAKCISE